MGAAGDSEWGAVPDEPRRSRAQTWLSILAVVGLALATGVGFVMARTSADRAADRRAAEAADRAASAVSLDLDRRVASLVGVATLVDPDGHLRLDAFDRFAADVVAAGDITALRLVGLDPTGARPVIAVHPADAPGPGEQEDLAADPVRGPAITAALTTGTATVSAVVDLDGAPALTLARPIVDRMVEPRSVAGVVLGAMPLDRLVERAVEAAGSGVEAALYDGDARLTGPTFRPDDRIAAASIEAPGRRWHVVVHPTAGADLALSWAILAAGTGAVLSVGLLLLVTARNQQHLGLANALLSLSDARTRAVQEATGRLARALTSDEVVVALLEHLPAAVGAESVALVIGEPGGSLEVVRADSKGGAPGREPLDPPRPGSLVDQALTTGEAAWLPSPLAWKDDALATALAAGGWAMALLPFDADEVSGVLAVAHPRVHIFREDEQALLETVSVLAARALARGRRYDAEHRAALAFQQAALPGDLPDVDGLTIAARYRPAALRATVGGDWYDVLRLDDGRVVVVVGDVVGHGMEAAAAMGRLRTAFQTIAPLRPDPGAIVRVVSQQVHTIPHALCTTVACVIIDPSARTMAWCRAGHPPPLLLGAGPSGLLDGAGTPPLGVTPDVHPPVHRRRLEPGQRLILYTDGVVERRGEPIDEGFERAAIVAAELSDLEPEDFCDALVEALVPVEEQSDDVVVLMVRVD